MNSYGFSHWVRVTRKIYYNLAFQPRPDRDLAGGQILGSDRFTDSQYVDSMEARPLLRIGGHQRAISIKYHHGEEKLKEITITRVEYA